VELIVTGELAEEAELECARWRAKMNANRLAVRFHQETLKNRMLNQCATAFVSDSNCSCAVQLSQCPDPRPARAAMQVRTADTPPAREN